jgi:hypothetical protein
MSEINPFQTIMQLATGYWVPRCLHVIAELGLADRLDETPETPEALAQAINVQPQALARVLRALAAFGVFEEIDGRFRHTPASRLLRSDHPQSQRSFVRMMGMPVHWAAYGELEHSIRTGHAAVTQMAPGGTFNYFATHPAESRLFDEAMTARSHEQIASVLGAYNFSGFNLIADIGGGRGHLLERVLAAAPRAKGVLFDLPHVIKALAVTSSDRLKLQPGDFFNDPLPTCDAYLLMSVIHDWGDAEATSILRAVRRAAPPHAKLLLLELLVPDAPGPHPAKLLDIEMLVMTTGGRERTRAEYERLYSAAGFRLEKIIPTASPTVILQGAVI